MNYNEYIKSFPRSLICDIKDFIAQICSLKNNWESLAKLVDMGALVRKTDKRELTVGAKYPKFSLSDIDDVLAGNKVICVRFPNNQFELMAELSPDMKDPKFAMYVEFAGKTPNWLNVLSADEFANDINTVLFEIDFRHGQYGKAMPKSEEYRHVASVLADLDKYLKSHKLHILSCDHNWVLVNENVNLDDEGECLPRDLQNNIWNLCAVTPVSDYERFDDNLFVV